MDKAGIAFAEYWTDLLPKYEFEAKIKEILAEAQEQLHRRKSLPFGQIQRQIGYFFEEDDEEID